MGAASYVNRAPSPLYNNALSEGCHKMKGRWRASGADRGGGQGKRGGKRGGGVGGIWDARRTLAVSRRLVDDQEGQLRNSAATTSKGACPRRKEGRGKRKR